MLQSRLSRVRLKELLCSHPYRKQRIRNLINPQQDLGHSDKGAFAAKETAPAKVEEPAGTSGAEPAPEVDDYTPRFRC